MRPFDPAPDVDETGPAACGWNGSLTPFRRAPLPPPPPIPAAVRERLASVYAELKASAERSRARGLTL